MDNLKSGMTIASLVLIVLGIACAVYGIIVWSALSGTPFFAVWLVLGIIFIGAGIALHVGLWAAVPAAGHWLIRVVAGIGIAWLVVTQALVLSGMNGINADSAQDAGLDCIIVLGAQVREGGPSIVLQARLDTAHAYLDAHPQTRCIVSGGQGANEPEPEAVAMARYLEAHGIDANRLSVESASLNTVQNIRNSSAMLDAADKRVGIVTNNFHVYRSVAIARKQGLVAVCGLPAPSHPMFLPNNLLRESFGVTKDVLMGNM